MIQLQRLRIEEFRGIRELDLELDGKSFAVWGPNGSGKSGVVDAIEFALTGNIARLSGAGTGGVTVLKHAPHVHQRDNAAAAKVMLGIRDPVSGQEGVLTRAVKTASSFNLSPDTPELRAAVEMAQQHPELTLSRREIIRYVVTEPGKRAQEVQALLKLDRIDQTRRLLRSATTKTASELSAAESELTNAEEAMRRHLDVPTLLSGEIAAEVNKRRSTLGLKELESVNIDTDLQLGAGESVGGSAFDKAGALRDVQALIDVVAHPEELTGAVDILRAAVDELIADPALNVALHHRNLVATGLDLVSEAACPLCDVPWVDIETLRAHLQEKLNRFEVANQLQQRIVAAGASVAAQLRADRELIGTATRYALSDGDAELPHRLHTWSEELAGIETKLASVDGTLELRERLSSDLLATSLEINTGMTRLIGALESKPDQSAAASARSFLTVAQERWTRVRLARASQSKANAAQIAAKTVYDIYCGVADEALTMLYKSVEEDFAAFYRELNADDEAAFKAELEPSAGKLDLSVDFYGLGMFPPAAYHSEGHQDGMGVCLYLALMKHLLGRDLRFVVLDDVVMSVDSGHRRQFCKLLKDRFPDVQFIITTHDEVWARQMQSAGLIERRSQAHFYGWTVDGGPVYEQGGDVWTRIERDLANDDVPGAAHKLRRYLEASTADVAESIGGRVPYRSDAAFELGELLDAVKGRHNDLLKKAAASANSWGNEEAKAEVERRKEERAKVIPIQETENWAINKLVHYNDGVNMSPSDFEPVLEACRQFLGLFHCASCNGTIYVVGTTGNEDSLRCSCGSYNLNLRSK